MRYLNKKTKNENNDHNSYYNVEKIIARKIRRNKKLYLIKWENFPLENCTWEPLSHLKNVFFLVEKFEKDYPHSICSSDLQKALNSVYQKESKRRHKKINSDGKPLKSLGDTKFVIDLEKNEILNFYEDENSDKKTENTEDYIDANEEEELNIKNQNQEIKPENMKLIMPIVIW